MRSRIPAVCVLLTHTPASRVRCQGRRRRLRPRTPPDRNPGGQEDMTMGLPDPAAALERAGRYRSLAEDALADRPLVREQALAVLRSPDDDLAAVLWGAFA